ncbi:uncharacterized protein Dwil_GK16330 [Drosophila willistoni]|uniref:DIRP domain-containing protein n=1 Tax=Drosophila willistoni TaxID=7260 RepID=B4N1L6_DROWI|nr:uncharacterized protein Dwil_GK16330 [Drosophila willistoni]
MPLAETSKNKSRKAVTTRKPFIDMDEEEEEGGGSSAIVDETMDDDANDQDETDEDDDDVGQTGEAAEPDDDDDDDDEGAEEDPDSNQSSEQEEQVEPPAFSLATLGLQRVGSAPPPKPKGQKAPIPTLNARGMPARIRKKNPLFYDENIINDDKPLRMSLAPKKVGPGRPPNSAGGNAAAKAAVGAIPSKVLKKRKGVVSRYMRTSDNGSSSNSASSQQGSGAVGKLKKTPIKLQSKSAGGAGGAAGRGQSAMHGKTGKGGIRSLEGGGKGQSALAAAMAMAQEDASKAEAVAATNKRLGQSIGLRLRNLLKLPKAHKWAIAEWFYSYIDKPLFDCKDEFMNHVSELAPRLGTRKLNRHEWVNIRRRMGRPRRCSANFFSEERKELDRKRQMMRTLQSRKPGELKEPGLLSDMPEKIPMPLPLGTKVTARLRAPQDGIFAGTVAAYDSLNAMYRVTFERPGLGTHSIPDYEIVSENFHEMLPLQSFTKDFRPNLVSIYHPSCLGFTTNLGFTANLSYSQKRLTPSVNGGIGGGGGTPGLQSSPQKHLATNNAAARNALSMKLNKSDPLLGQDAVGESPGRQQLTRHHGYPMKLLEHLLHLENYITCKNSKIQRLNKMNTTAELTMGEMVGQEEVGDRQRKVLRDDFQRRYASNIISIERINSELMYELTKVQELSSSLTRNPNVQAMISPTYLREECRTKAGDTVDDLNKGLVKSARMIKLLKNLTTLLIVTQNLGGECESNEVNKVLEGCIEEVRSNLVCSDNIVVFQKSVQLRLEYIAMDITRCLEEQGLNRTTEHGTKSPKSETLEESLDQVVPDDDDDKAQNQQNREKDQQNESSGHKDEHHDRADHMDVDNVEHEMESEEEKKHDTREPRESPQPATIEDSQITIESVKESEEDDDTEEDHHQSPQQKQKPNVKEFHSQMEVLEDDDDDEEFILEDEN